MRTRYRAPVLAALLPLVLLSVGCDLVRAKAAFKDGNRLYKEENYRKAIDEYEKAVAAQARLRGGALLPGQLPAVPLPAGQGGGREPDAPGQGHRALREVARAQQGRHAEPAAGPPEHARRARPRSTRSRPLSNYEKALGYAEQLVKDNPNDIKNLYAMANLYEKFNRVAEAEQTYEKVVEQNPKDVKACGALAAFYNKPLWDEQGAGLGGGHEQGRPPREVRRRHRDPRQVRGHRPHRPQRALQARDVLLGQGLPRPHARRQGEERVRRQGHRGGRTSRSRRSPTTGRRSSRRACSTA